MKIIQQKIYETLNHGGLEHTTYEHRVQCSKFHFKFTYLPNSELSVITVLHGLGHAVDVNVHTRGRNPFATLLTRTKARCICNAIATATATNTPMAEVGPLSTQDQDTM